MAAKDLLLWIVKRVGIAIASLLFVISATYILLRYAPGNPVQVYIGSCLAKAIATYL